MAVLNIVVKEFNLAEGTMEILVVDIIDDAVHPCAVILLPLLALLQIAHISGVGIVEIGIAVCHLRLIEALHQLLLL